MSTTDNSLNRLLDLLIQRPNANELLKALETNFLSKYKLSNAMIFTLDSHNASKEIYSNNSLTESNNSQDFASVLASLSAGADLSSLIDSKIGKGVENDFIIIPVSNGKSLSGFILLVLDCAELSPEDISQIETMGKVCAFYLINELSELNSSNLVNKRFAQIQFSARQIQILHGFIEGKTNHELAVDLGFSVSTIRHETMDIFRLLGASDRKEAAKIAQERSIV